MGATATSTSSAGDISDILPLRLIKSETVPPAPNLSASVTAIDWLPDFGGYSWIAYGAASLLVISHFPSPLSPQESRIGPIFRQVFELPFRSSATDVAAVSWSPASPSIGNLAVAVDNRIFLYEYDSGQGSFCWSQSALLVQSAKVEAIKWTGSGDGIISGGMEVILWKRNARTWEIAWKFGMKEPQTLVSSAFSVEGPSATGVYPTKLHAEGLSLLTHNSNYVTVLHGNGNSACAITELKHPQPVVMIQWRPSGGRILNGNSGHSSRHVLLTCCLDGTLRLWSEIDKGRVRKSNKDIHDFTASKQSFHVVAVIEVNQTLNGHLGTDIFVSWAMDIEGVVRSGEVSYQQFSTKGHHHDEVGQCEWLIGLGPGKMLTLWAVHCLDDIATMRSPRITLWNRQEILFPAVRSSLKHHHLNFMDGSHFNKVAIMRNQLFGPPTICSLIQLLPGNFLGWSLLYSHVSAEAEQRSPNVDEADTALFCQAGELLGVNGHTGKILQFTVHPHKCERQFAVSLDSNGFLLIWSISSSTNGISGLATFNPSWKLLGEILLQDIFSQHLNVVWAPSWLNEERILLIGHAEGIDCFIIKIPESKEEGVLFYKLCTIPFADSDQADGPEKIFSVPLQSTCKATFNFNHFMVVSVFAKDCQALSWEVTLHSYDSAGSCECNFGMRSCFERTLVHQVEYSGKRYCIVVNPCSSYFPHVDGQGQVTSVCSVCPGISMPSPQQKSDPLGDCFPSYLPYHMATGHFDGRVRLWRSKQSESSVSHIPWELVGMFTAPQGPIAAISIADCGQKIATISSAHSSSQSMLSIWEPLCLVGPGSVKLEDKICLNGNTSALRWFVVRDCLLFLGVCFQNELRIYAQRCFNGQTLLNTRKPSEDSIWLCISVLHTMPTIYDFVWGPRAMIMIVHEKYFSVFSQWSPLVHEKYLTEFQLNQGSSVFFSHKMDEENLSAYTTRGVTDVENLSLEERSDIFSCLLTKDNLQKDVLCTSGCFLSMTEVAEKLCSSMPFYHPRALLTNIYSGNWNRARVAVRHLVKCLASNAAPESGLNSPKSGHFIPQINLSNYFEGQLSTGDNPKGFHWSRNLDSAPWSLHSNRSMQLPDSFSYFAFSNTASVSPASSEFDVFLDTVGKYHMFAALSDSQKTETFAIIDLLHEISNSQSDSPYKSLDEPGRRFWCAVRFQQLYFFRRYDRMPSIEELVVDSRLIGWAFHSDCQENLFSAVLPTDPSWHEMRKMGIGYWFTNVSQLRQKMEKLARLQYLKNKDPKACMLLYVALNRLQVLAGLFKISKDEKDKPLVAFLSRNFQEEKHKAAALKNAYVLMGRHQLEMAIAFFLLGGDTMSAITVCAKTLGDEQLSLVICDLIEGPGGPLERHIISKFILPSAIEKGDYWLASLLKWVLGDYLESFMVMLASYGYSDVNGPADLGKHPAFIDPSVGQYCQILAAKNSLKNAVGEQNAAILCRWALVMTATALKKSGLPLEALECLSSSSNTGPANREIEAGNSETLLKMLRPSPATSSSWLSSEVASHLEYQTKSDLALQCILKLMREHPGWLTATSESNEAGPHGQGYEMTGYQTQLESFQEKFNCTLRFFEQKFSLTPDLLLNKLMISLSNDGLALIGYDVLHSFAWQGHLSTMSHSVSGFPLFSNLMKQLPDAAIELSCTVSRFASACSMACSWQILPMSSNHVSVVKRYIQLYSLEFCRRDLLLSLGSLKAAMMLLYCTENKDLIAQSFEILDICKYCAYFALAEFQQNLKALVLMVQAPLISYINGGYYEADLMGLREILSQMPEILGSESLGNGGWMYIQGTTETCKDHDEDNMSVIPDDEKWQIIRAGLWRHMSKYITRNLYHLSDKLNSMTVDKSSDLTSTEHDGNRSAEHIRLASLKFLELIGDTVSQISSHHARQLIGFLWQKVEDGVSVPTLRWLHEYMQHKPGVLPENLKNSVHLLQELNKETESSCYELLWNICADPRMVSEMLAQLRINLLELIHWKPFRGWSDLHADLLEGHERRETLKRGGFSGSTSPKSDGGNPAVEFSEQGQDSDKRETDVYKKVALFQNPTEIYRRSGELFEAICLNSVDQRQAALASNKKGIVFFNWDDGLPSRVKSDYIWSEADWPRNGWADAESTSGPTRVSSGVGLRDKMGSHLGLGGAAVGSHTRPGRDITGGGAFGIPGYAGIGASGLGWGIEEDFDKFVDPPATLENVSAVTLASHPSRPLFLVGSSSTHIYLWEFGKDKAAATYGVLPAPNVPPPYPLASVTALQFDRCGHRFANAASDGTVCTWQLEVGGRSNVRPTESSLCFNGHASDISYVATSGSIISVAGYSSDGVNVIIWDTLAPPATSRASVMCHEGGACSISVFDNDVGSGSISPLIVTGGKGGDVGLHDFRYIATGKTKRRRQLHNSEQAADTSSDSRSGISHSTGDQNRNGMLWYIPKAHSGSVTKIATIPNTSLFLTGSKDGDVKLWDIKGANLVFHWPKLHERHTFLQRSSQSFGGITREAVTDIKVIANGFLSCGGDSSVKLVRL